MSQDETLKGERNVIDMHSQEYPEMLKQLARPPQKLYCIGDISALQPGVGIIGARKATPYGLSCATYFANHVALRGATIVSGGARGCDQAAHKAALAADVPTVVVFGSGADVPYPRRGIPLFKKVLAQGGVIVSESPWGTPPRPALFPQRNRIIAGLSVLLLIVEAGLPSGTLSTADEALAQGKDVAVVPGAITSPYAKGVNYLLTQGATPIISVENLDDALKAAFERFPLMLAQAQARREADDELATLFANDCILRALAADAYTPSELTAYFGLSASELGSRLSAYEMQGLVQRGRDGRYQVCLPA